MSNHKNVLVITYYWPPAGGPGVQRWLGFIRHLPSFGFFSHVYVPKNPSYPIIDQTLVKELPKQYKLIKKNIWEPFQIAEWFYPKTKEYKKGNLTNKKNSFLDNLFIAIRGNLFIPDPRVFWVNPSVLYLKKYIKENQITTIITSGPPHSMHLIGLKLKKQLPEINWLADFRDPWTEISYHKHLNLFEWAKKKHLQLENQVLTNANTVIATSYIDAKNYKLKGAKNAITITNGYEPQKINSKIDKTKNKKFILSYVGGLEDLRNPSFFWALLEEILNENREFQNLFILRFVGTISANILQEINTKYKQLVNCVEIINYLPHQLAVEEMQKANALLLCNFMEESAKGIIPGKLFEYLANQTPIFAIGPIGADVEEIIAETQAGFYFSKENRVEAKNYLIELIANWQQKKEIKPIDINKFTRNYLTQQLSLHIK